MQVCPQGSMGAIHLRRAQKEWDLVFQAFSARLPLDQTGPQSAYNTADVLKDISRLSCERPRVFPLFAVGLPRREGEGSSFEALIGFRMR